MITDGNILNSLNIFTKMKMDFLNRFLKIVKKIL
nr:MAG TPA: hypothetical protein [Caudoviricetes sp.]